MKVSDRKPYIKKHQGILKIPCDLSVAESRQKDDVPQERNTKKPRRRYGHHLRPLAMGRGCPQRVANHYEKYVWEVLEQQ